jgi:hypothetical protein
MANARYKQIVEQQKMDEEISRKKRIQQELEIEEKRKSILRDIKI